MSTQQIEPFLRLVREQIKQKIIRHIERIQLCGSGYSIDGIASFDIKYAIIPFGGCGHKFKKEKYGKYKGINWPNECKEQLCFWRCLAMFTCKDEIKLITDPKGKEQRIKAKELHDKHSPIPENLVNIAMLDKISESTNLNIIVYSIQPAVKESVVQKLTQIYMSQIYEDRKTIELVLAEEEHHYGWLRSKEGVITERQCQFCFKKFSDKTKNTSALKEHEKRCLAKKSISDAKEELTFHEKRIRKFKSVSHKYLHEDLQRQYYISYDFETLNVKHTEQLSQGETLCALPKAIGYSMMLHEFSKEHGEFKPVTELDEFRFPIEYVGTDCAKHLVDQLCKFKPLLEANLKQKMIEKQVEWGTSLEYLECKNPKHNKDCSCARDKAKGKIIHEFMTVPVYGYNSGGFDIYLMLKSMSRFNFSDVQYRDGVYTKLRVDDFYDFVDAHALVPPSVNLERFGQLFSSQRIHKELFPYDWMDDERKLSETKFPPYNVFYNRLKNESPKKSDYILHKMLFEHDKKLTFGKYVALSLGFCDREINTKEELIQDIGEEKTKGIIWDHLVEDYTRAIKDYSKINTMKDYMMFYCTRDVELLAEGMNGYYKLLKKEDGFDLLKFTTIASLAERIAYVNYIKTPIYSIPNKECYDMARGSLFGGNCQVFQKKLEDNGNFKCSQDANNLYGGAMRCRLPTKMGLEDVEDVAAHSAARLSLRDQDPDLLLGSSNQANQSKGLIQSKSLNARSVVPESESFKRCNFINSKGWRCMRPAKEGQERCGYHSNRNLTKLDEARQAITAVQPKEIEESKSVIGEVSIAQTDISERKGGIADISSIKKFMEEQNDNSEDSIISSKEELTQKDEDLDFSKSKNSFLSQKSSFLSQNRLHSNNPFLQDDAMVSYDFLMNVLEEEYLQEQVKHNPAYTALFLENYISVIYADYIKEIIKRFIEGSKDSSEKIRMISEKMARMIIERYKRIPEKFQRELHIFRDLRNISKFSQQDRLNLYKIFKSLI
eukprot:TRINITY_DN1351_c0_g1_i11.p1 TRINITY_DN1351_c0_g1~~TRINITY_DN1351_c0_g1_i11.p1  ORF type:complete len:1081 (+),score=75.66 TRINITY_DN1351_c0_g1_i11:236-3244(+)